MSVDSIKHKHAQRPHIPSREEEGYEKNNPLVEFATEKALPKNPVIHRGHDPELFWMNKYQRDAEINQVLETLLKQARQTKNVELENQLQVLYDLLSHPTQDAWDERLKIDIRSLYRHEHISPEIMMKYFYRLKETPAGQLNMFDVNQLFGNALEMDELEKVSEYYKHQDGWSNRLIQGDSLLVMTSLLEREGFAGKVQCIYIDPPYGIKYGSNWQMKLNNRNVKDGSDDDLTGEPEQVKAYRDTWELGIHSYLSYLRDRLLVARELLTDSGSCFVQISDENVHLVRNLMDEVFGSENFVNEINYRKTSAQTSEKALPSVSDFILWYAKEKLNIKFRPLFIEKDPIGDINYKFIEYPTGTRESHNNKDAARKYLNGEGKLYRLDQVTSQTGTESSRFGYEFQSKCFKPSGSRGWSTSKEGLNRLAEKGRLEAPAGILCYIRYFDDFPVSPLTNYWKDTASGGFADEKIYVVQSGSKAIQRCILSCTDPGDLVLDPTCGSGTTAYVAEQWGRRWMTIDTSRIALNIAKTRLMTAAFPYYKLFDETNADIRQGFVYKKVPHITLKSLANDEPSADETLYDQPEEDRSKLRVAGPFTVETLQNFEPTSPECLDSDDRDDVDLSKFEETVFEHLKSAGIKNGMRNEQAVFIRVERLASAFLNAEGFYQSASGEKKAYFHIGPKFGTVSKQAVNEAVKECRARGDSDWLVILGFSFESDISNENITTSVGSFEVTRTRMHDDLLQDGLLKRDKKAASFVTIGEPDIAVHPVSVEDKSGRYVQVEIKGLDIYDPIHDEVKARNISDIAYWMVDDDYDGNNFIVRQVFFCGNGNDELSKWHKGLEHLAKPIAKKNAEKRLRIEIDDEAFDRVYGHKSHPIRVKKLHQKIAVRVISQFGEESTKVMGVVK